MHFTKILPLVFAALPMTLGQNVPKVISITMLSISSGLLVNYLKEQDPCEERLQGSHFRIPRGWTMLGSYLSAVSTAVDHPRFCEQTT